MGLCQLACNKQVGVFNPFQLGPPPTHTNTGKGMSNLCSSSDAALWRCVGFPDFGACSVRLKHRPIGVEFGREACVLFPRFQVLLWLQTWNKQAVFVGRRSLGVLDRAGHQITGKKKRNFSSAEWKPGPFPNHMQKNIVIASRSTFPSGYFHQGAPFRLF